MPNEFLFFIFLFGICWGSFLHVIADRLIRNVSFFTTRSYCPACKKKIAWYDLIPLISWIALRGSCRLCTRFISPLYFFSELITGLCALLIFISLSFSFSDTFFLYPFLSSSFWFSYLSYFIFFSALIIATLTDLQAMVVYQVTTLWVVPVGFCASYAGFLQISFFESIAGALVGYLFLFLIDALFRFITKKNGIGEGDFEILTLIGSFLGVTGVWFSVLLGSSFGLVYAIPYLFITKQSRATRIPFVPFLALGALIFFLFGNAFSLI